MKSAKFFLSISMVLLLQVFAADWNKAPVAVKRLDDLDSLLRTQPAVATKKLLDDLHAEAGLMAALRHPNIVAFMGICTSPPAIVTELCAKGSLADVLRIATGDPASLLWPLRLRMAVDAAAGMYHLHCQSPPIIHRDLKSPNLLVDKDWNVKVTNGGGAAHYNDHGCQRHPPPAYAPTLMLLSRLPISTSPRLWQTRRTAGREMNLPWRT